MKKIKQNERMKMVIVMDGGNIQQIIVDNKDLLEHLDVVCFDEDVEGMDDEDLTDYLEYSDTYPKGFLEKVFIHLGELDYEPQEVKNIFKAYEKKLEKEGL